MLTALFCGTAIRLRLEGTELRVGRAVLEHGYVDAVRRWRPTRPAPDRSRCRRAGVPGPASVRRTAVEISLDDPADPVPYWLVSSRRPVELAEAIGAVLAADHARPAR